VEILVLFRRGGSQSSAGPSAEPVYHGWPQGPVAGRVDRFRQRPIMALGSVS